jgi:large subunit ribosomal protein L4
MASAAPKAATIGKQAKTDLPAAVFAEPYNESLVHEAARADMNARRQGTHSSLTRGEVAMTGAKAWRQKGTGRARVGALSVHAARGSIAVLPADSFSEPATKQAAEGLAKWGGAMPALVVVTGEESAAAKSYRNLPRVSVVTAEAVGVAEIVGHRSLIASEGALEVLSGRAGEVARGGAANDEGSEG